MTQLIKTIILPNTTFVIKVCIKSTGKEIVRYFCFIKEYIFIIMWKALQFSNSVPLQPDDDFYTVEGTCAKYVHSYGGFEDVTMAVIYLNLSQK